MGKSKDISNKPIKLLERLYEEIKEVNSYDEVSLHRLLLSSIEARLEHIITLLKKGKHEKAKA